MSHPFLAASVAHAAAFAISRIVWPYFTGIALTLIGLVKIFRHDLPQAKGLDKALVFGPLFLAMPVAVFGTDHFTFPDVVAGMVPRFIPFQRVLGLFCRACAHFRERQHHPRCLFCSGGRASQRNNILICPVNFRPRGGLRSSQPVFARGHAA